MNYPWLRDRKMQAKIAKGREQQVPGEALHAGLNRNLLFGINNPNSIATFTGQGNPNSISMVTNDGSPIHKGELMFGGPGNGKVITDAISSRELMSNPVMANRIDGIYPAGMKCGGYKKGYQEGGYTNEPPPLTEEEMKRLGITKDTQVSPVTNFNNANTQTNYVSPKQNMPSVTPTTTPSNLSPDKYQSNIAAPNTNSQVSPTIDSNLLRKQGLESIQKMLSEGSVAGRLASQKAISDLKNTQGVERQMLQQQLAQRGISGSEAGSQMARLGSAQAGQVEQATSQAVTEQEAAKERAAQMLAQEGKTQFDIELAKDVQGLNEAQFNEFIRQFEVGSDQWNKAFDERRKQFEVGSEQWNRTFEEQRRQFDVGSQQWNMSFDEQRRQFNVGSDQWNRTFEEQRRQFEVGSEQWQKSFDEQRRQYDQNFLEQRYQFDVGSEQWNKSFDEQRALNWANHNEQIRQFNVGSEQWEKARKDQLDQWQQNFAEQRRQFNVGSDQWNKSFQLEREKFDAEDERWWSSFDEQRRQFDVGSQQWQKTFDEQKRQFDVGSDQWNKVHDLQVKQFAQQVDMDKHTVEVWKDNVAFRDRTYLDSLSMDKQRLEMERAVHEKNMKLYDFKIDATKSDVASQKYWAASERLFNYASTHIDGFDEKTGNFTPDAENEMFNWYKSKYPGRFDDYNNVDHLRGFPQAYSEFKNWAMTEWKAATDNRLTNPYDKMLYDVNSSSLDQASKDILKKVLTSPEALAQIAGIVYDPETDTVQVKTKDSQGTITNVQNIKAPELSNVMNKYIPGQGQTQTKKEGPGPVGPGPEVGPVGPGPVGPGPKGPEITLV